MRASAALRGSRTSAAIVAQARIDERAAVARGGGVDHERGARRRVSRARGDHARDGQRAGGSEGGKGGGKASHTYEHTTYDASFDQTFPTHVTRGAGDPSRPGLPPAWLHVPHRLHRQHPRDERRRGAGRRRLAVDGLARVLGQGPRSRLGGHAGDRAPVRPRARLPPQRRRAGPALGDLARRGAAGPRCDQPVLRPRPARGPARGAGGRLHRGAGRHRQRPALGGAVLPGAARRPGRRLPAVRGDAARGHGARRARRAHRVPGAATLVGALRLRGRRRGGLRAICSSSGTAASAIWPPPSRPPPSTCARRPGGGCWPRPGSTPTRCRAP